MMEKVSVVVLTYNVGAYLRDCISSILKQTYSNLEILLVDDSSTDNSLAICQEFAQQDPRIKILQEVNSGAGPVRNLGAQAATGDYVMFIDGDDFLAPEAIEKLLQRLHHDHSDIACCLFYRIDDQGTYYFYTDNNDPQQKALTGPYTPQQWVHNEIRPVVGQIYYQAWAKLFKRSLFQNIEYPHHSYGDDALTGWKLYLAAHRISYLNESYYCWRMRNNSITKSKHPNMRGVVNNALAIQNRAAFFPRININPLFLRDRWLDYLKNQQNAAQITSDDRDEADASLKLQILHKYIDGE